MKNRGAVSLYMSVEFHWRSLRIQFRTGSGFSIEQLAFYLQTDYAETLSCVCSIGNAVTALQVDNKNAFYEAFRKITAFDTERREYVLDSQPILLPKDTEIFPSMHMSLVLRHNQNVLPFICIMFH